MAKVARKKRTKQPRATKRGRSATPRGGLGLPAPFAVMSDGRVLINVAECKGHTLEGRERFTGVVLSPREVLSVLRRVDHEFADAAARIAGAMPARHRSKRNATVKSGRGKRTRTQR